MDIETEHFKNGIEFLKEHPIQRINRNPEISYENPFLSYPHINLNHHVILNDTEFGGLQIMGNVNSGGDPNLLSEIIIRLAGAYKSETDTDIYGVYPRLKEGEPMPLYYNDRNNVVNESLSILEKKYPDLIRRSS